MSYDHFLVVANFKSHQTLSELNTWLDHVSPRPHVLIAPSYPYLTLANSRWPQAVCAQDVSPFPPGSYTGAVNAQQLKDLGVTHCLIGHSERRRYFAETSAMVANKARELHSVQITPIICLREADLQPDRAALEDNLLEHAHFCYEPEADIGGTTTAPLDQIIRITKDIKQIFHTEHVMYGGSVNADNIPSLLNLDLAGVLVATASLDPDSINSLLDQLPHD